MADVYKSIKITQPTPGGPLVEQVVGAVYATGAMPPFPASTSPDGYKLVALGPNGTIDPSLTSGSGFPVTTPEQVQSGGSITVTGTGIIEATELATTGSPVIINTTAPTGSGQTLVSTSTTNATWQTISSTTSFSGITSGFNTAAAMDVDTGASLTYASGGVPNVNGGGTVNANVIGTINVAGNTPAYAGQILISQGSGSGSTALWADPFVQGPYAPGTNVTTGGISGGPINPVLVGGQNPSNLLENLRLDASGNLFVSQQGTVTITGTVAVTQSTSPWVTSDQNFVTQGSTTSGQKGLLTQGAVTTAAPTYTTGQTAPLSLDTAGNLRTTAVFTGTLSNNITQWASTSLGAPSAFGTSPGLVNVIGTNSVIYAIKSGTPAALITDGAGNLDVNTQAAVFAAANGTAVPTSAVWLGASDGTNLQGLLTESVGNKNLRVAIFQGGNVANVSSNRLLVDPSGTTMTVNQGTSPWVTADNQLVSQGSTTSGQKGPLVQGAVTTNDPTYTTAQTDPLSLTTTGHLRTQDSAEANANGSTSPPTNAMYVGGKGADGFLHPLSTDNSGILNVNASFSGTVTPGFVTDRVQSGAITSTQNVFISTYGAASVIFNITGSWTGTIQFQSQLADNSWVTATAYPVFIGGAGVTQTTTNGEWQIPVGGMQAFRVLGNTVGSGTATANLEAGAGAYSMFVQQLSASDLNATVVQGNAGSIAQSWFVKVTDGSNVFGTTSSFPFFMQGTKTNNNAAPGSNNFGVLPALANAASPSYTDGDQVLLSVDTTGALRVSSSGTFTPALTADITATGTITNTQNVTLVTQGTGTTQFNITGSWTGTIVFEASVDGVNFVAAKVLPRYPTAFPEVSQTTANGQWAIATGGLAKFRVRGANVTSGTATAWLEGGAGAQDIQTLAMVFDPVSGNVPAVKGSTTVPVAADNALVVSLSPNSAQFATSTTANTLPGVNPITVGASSVAVVNSNTARKEVTIVNTGTTVIFLGLGQTPTTTAYHIALAKCTAANDGTGGTWTSDMWKGSVNAIGSAGGGTVNLTELT